MLSAIKHLLPQLCHQHCGCGFAGLPSSKSVTLAVDPSRGTDKNSCWLNGKVVGTLLIVILLLIIIMICTAGVPKGSQEN